jgi:Uma2 family endonuclease
MPATDAPTHHLEPINISALNALAYCPRLYYLQTVEGIQETTADMYTGLRLHIELEAENSGDWQQLTLENVELGLRGRVDALKTNSGNIIPYEHKKGRSDREQLRLRLEPILTAADSLLIAGLCNRCVERIESCNWRYTKSNWQLPQRLRTPNVVHSLQTHISLEAFLTSPEASDRSELINGQVIPKVAPKRFHSKTQRALLRLLEDWGDDKGEIGVEWAVQLTRNDQPWVPVPDLSFTYRDRLPADIADVACPVPVDLAVEIISPDQTFGMMAEKATDYITAGVTRVWIVDPISQTITIFAPGTLPVTYRGDRTMADAHLPDLTLTAQVVFAKAGLLK